MKQRHDIQLGILKKLLFVPSARYKDLKPEKSIENNKLQFHLDSLVSDKLVHKIDSNYELTTFGKEYAGRIDTERHVKVLKQAKIGAFVCPIRTNADNQVEVLMYTRKKQPFYGCQGFMSGKVEYGETITEAAERELFEETGLKGAAEVVKVVHYLEYNSEKNLAEDKLIFWCRVKEPTGELLPNEEGDFFWIKPERISETITKPFDSIEELINQTAVCLNSDKLKDFIENRRVTDDF